MKTLVTVKLVLTLGLFLLVSMTYAQGRRPVVWVGGLNEGNEFWANYATLFQQERQMNSDRDSYSAASRAGVNGMAAIVRTHGAVGGNSLGIGHSMGGVALREVDRNDPNRFSAYITMGSPMNGTQVAVSVLNGSLRVAIDDGVGRMLAGPNANSLAIPFVDGLLVDDFVRKIGKAISPEVNTFGRQTLTDLSPGSAYMQGIRNFAGNVPAVSIQGVENGPVHWRIATSAMQGEGNAVEDDEKLVQTANRFYDFYNAHYIANLAGGPLFWYFANKWKQGRDYIRDQSEPDYLNIIGARRVEIIDYPYQNYLCGNEGFEYNQYRECIADANYNNGDPRECDHWCWQTGTYQVSVTIEELSDAFITASSQIGQGTAWQRSAGDIYRAEGANHLQQSNHSQVTLQFNRIFNRNDRFFRIP
ncbi:MAG: hypothetical protein V4714_10070 [Bacteroidota bacterium]